MKDLDVLDVMGYATRKMGKEGGVFLTVPGETPNTMTIGWGWIGWCWNKPVFITVVRPQRHTLGLLKRAGCFTVSVPTGDPLRAQLKLAGTRSGRDINKFDGHGLTAAPARKVDAPIVAECGLHFECETRLAQGAMSISGMDPAVLAGCYPDRDMHEIFFGEIVACYATDDAFAAQYAR